MWGGTLDQDQDGENEQDEEDDDDRGGDKYKYMILLLANYGWLILSDGQKTAPPLPNRFLVWRIGDSSKVIARILEMAARQFILYYISLSSSKYK